MAPDDADRPGDWLAFALVRFLEFSGEALRMLASEADPADRRMLTRRVAEYGIACEDGLDPGAVPGPGPHASTEWRDCWDSTETELLNAELDWAHRYDTRPATAREHRIADLMLAGLISLEKSPGTAGIDGTLYAPARREHAPGRLDPALVAVTDAGIIEVITGFRDREHRAAWLADRCHGLRGTAGGLPPPVVPLAQDAGPDCLARAEERALAWLLRTPGAARGSAPGSAARLEPHAFSSHVRTEIFQAWQSASGEGEGQAPGTVRHELARRLLRAPAWAGPGVGWPFGCTGLAYFDRLSATPAEEGPALSALGLLADKVAVLRETVPSAPEPVTADPCSYLGRAAARGLRLTAFQPPSAW